MDAVAEECTRRKHHPEWSNVSLAVSDPFSWREGSLNREEIYPYGEDSSLDREILFLSRENLCPSRESFFN
jgi:hypothetical protein